MHSSSLLFAACGVVFFNINDKVGCKRENYFLLFISLHSKKKKKKVSKLLQSKKTLTVTAITPKKQKTKTMKTWIHVELLRHV